MANSIAKITGYVVREAARGFYNSRLFSGLIDHKYDNEFAVDGAKVGQTIYVKKPAKYRVRSGANQQVQDVVQAVIPVTLPAQVGVDFEFSTREMTLDIDNGSKSFAEQTITPAGSAIASSKDAEGLQIAALNAGYTIVTAATPAYADFTKAKAFLNKQLAPKGVSDRIAFVGSDVESAIANEIKVLYNSAAEVTKAIKENELQVTGGMTFASTDLAFVRTNGGGGGTVTLGAAITPDYVNETQTITIAGAGAGNVAVGDTLQFAASYFINPETKAVYANLVQRRVLVKPTGTTVTVASIRPKLAAGNGAGQDNYDSSTRAQSAAANVDALPSNGSTITVLGTAGTKYLCSVVMHKSAMTLTSVDLVKPSKGVEQIDSITVDGMNIRYIRAYGIGSDVLSSRLDTLSAYSVITPEWICVLETPLA
jgi:hypothetical protein